MIYKPLVLQ